MKYFGLMLALTVALFASLAEAQSLTTLIDFTGSSGTASGANPSGALALSGTTLYGMTTYGGRNGFGNIFSVATDGANYQNLVSFTGSAGSASGFWPFGSLTLSGTTLYGMTYEGEDTFYGNIFSVSMAGTNYQNLVSFTGSGGSASGMLPYGSLILSGSTLYGMTSEANNGYGNIFSVGTGAMNYQNLVAFTGSGGSASGDLASGSLTLSGTRLYGMTSEGGAKGYGNIFSVGTGGTDYQNLVSFSGEGGTASGELPTGSLTLAGTALYGMTYEGGANGDGNIFSVGIDGTNYQSIVSFTGSGGSASGNSPRGSLTLSGTTLYGTARYGGADDWGDIFSVGINGSNFDDLYDFTGGGDGAAPAGDLTISGGTLFGMTSGGGPNGDGTIFAFILPTPTPEPGTLALVATAAVATMAYRWRRRRSRRQR